MKLLNWRGEKIDEATKQNQLNARPLSTSAIGWTLNASTHRNHILLPEQEILIRLYIFYPPMQLDQY